MSRVRITMTLEYEVECEGGPIKAAWPVVDGKHWNPNAERPFDTDAIFIDPGIEMVDVLDGDSYCFDAYVDADGYIRCECDPDECDLAALQSEEVGP